MNLIFAFLCGCLYVVGLIFGLDYKQVSVLVCCWLWPAICTASVLPLLYVAVRDFFRCKLALTRILYYVIACIAFAYFYFCFCFTNECLDRYPEMDEVTFNLCMKDLQVLAAHIGISYEALNLLFYVVLFAVILTFNISACRLLSKCKNWLEEKLSKSKFIMAIEKRGYIIAPIGAVVMVATPFIVFLFTWAISVCIEQSIFLPHGYIIAPYYGG